MKREQIALELTTTPSRFVNSLLPEFPVDYKRIVAISGPVGRVACEYPVYGEMTTEEVRVTPQFGQALFDFFGRWLVKRDPQAGGSLWKDEANYQCHRYALNMQNRTPVSGAAAHYAVMAMDSRAGILADPSLPLPFGTHVCIRGPRGLAHSSVAIGIGPDGKQNTPDPTDHIQVFDYGGNLGIAPLVAELEYYGKTATLPKRTLQERLFRMP